jgi:hypothetical protein
LDQSNRREAIREQIGSIQSNVLWNAARHSAEAEVKLGGSHELLHLTFHTPSYNAHLPKISYSAKLNGSRNIYNKLMDREDLNTRQHLENVTYIDSYQSRYISVEEAGTSQIFPQDAHV